MARANAHQAFAKAAALRQAARAFEKFWTYDSESCHQGKLLAQRMLSRADKWELKANIRESVTTATQGTTKEQRCI